MRIDNEIGRAPIAFAMRSPFSAFAFSALVASLVVSVGFLSVSHSSQDAYRKAVALLQRYPVIDG